MPSRKELRRAMIRALGSRCHDCGKEFDPDDLIIHHLGFERGQPLGYERSRSKEIYEYARTGRLPTDVILLCDDCNRKRHGYRTSKRRIFGLDK